MKLTQLLKELKWKASTFEMCMNEMVPLSLPIIKKLVETKRAKTFHITDVYHIDTVLRLQGKSKSISTFSKADFGIGPATGKGMWTDGGVLILLSGIVLADSVNDMWTAPDESGRRWVRPGHVLFDGFARTHKIMDFAPPQLKQLKEKYEKEGDLSGKEKQYFIKTYIDTAYKVMLKYKDDFQKKYFGSKGLWYEDNWNEVVLSQIKVEKIALVEGFVSDESIQWAKKKYGKVEIINRNAIPSFLERNGVYVRK